MTEILEVLHLAHQHRVAEMNIGRGGIEAGLDAQGPIGLEFFDEFRLDKHLVAAAFDSRQVVLKRCHFGQSPTTSCGIRRLHAGTVLLSLRRRSKASP